MAFLTQGGSQVSSSQIVDGAIVNADINAAAAIALTKLSGLIGNPGSFISIESTDGTTHSLTTVANQRVLVFAQFYMTGGANPQLLYLKYNGTTKATGQGNAGSNSESTMLMYTEVPGAATANITIERQSDGTFVNPRIVVIKLQESA